MAAVQGYNIAFRVNYAGGYKTFAGRTQDDLTIAARTKERLMKSNQGTPDVVVTGQDLTFRATGLVDLSTSGVVGRNQLLGMIINAVSLTFKYAIGGDTEYLTGNCIITNFSESSNSSDDATYTADFRVTGEVAVENEDEA